MNLRFLAAVAAAVALLGCLPLWWMLQESRVAESSATAQDVSSEATQTADSAPALASTPTADTPPPAAIPDEPPRPEKPQPELITGPDPGRSPLADRLNAADGAISEDLAILQRVLNNFLLEVGANPVGSNREITAQLSGRNARHHAPLPRDLPAIDARGELVDRWGTPFFFHALSAREMEIRSAGPDREIYTADDAVESPRPKNDSM